MIRGAEALESSRAITTVVLDKTGTLTTGAMLVHETAGDPDAIRLAGCARGVQRAPGRAGDRRPRRRAGAPVEEFANEPGIGVRGRVEGHRVHVGRTPDPATLPTDLADAVTARRTPPAGPPCWSASTTSPAR